LEEQRGLFVVEAEVADFIDDQELWSREHFQVVRHAVLGEGGFHPTGQFQRGEEDQSRAALGAAQAEADGEVGFADAGWAQKHDVAVFGEVATGGEFVDELGIERGLGFEVEVVQAFFRGKTAEPEIEGDVAAVPLGEFFGEVCFDP
jgi:hypothetical protein